MAVFIFVEVIIGMAHEARDGNVAAPQRVAANPAGAVVTEWLASRKANDVDDN
jgi:hypothetical protein